VIQNGYLALPPCCSQGKISTDRVDQFTTTHPANAGNRADFGSSVGVWFALLFVRIDHRALRIVRPIYCLGLYLTTSRKWLDAQRSIGARNVERKKKIVQADTKGRKLDGCREEEI